MNRLYIIIICLLSKISLYGQILIEGEKVAVPDIGVVKIYNYPEGNLDTIIAAQGYNRLISYNTNRSELYAAGNDYMHRIDMKTKKTTSLFVKEKEADEKTSSGPDEIRLMGLNANGIAAYGKGIEKKKVLLYDCKSMTKSKILTFDSPILNIWLQDEGYVTNHGKSIQKRTIDTNEIIKEYITVENNDKLSIIDWGKYIVLLRFISVDIGDPPAYHHELKFVNKETSTIAQSKNVTFHDTQSIISLFTFNSLIADPPVFGFKHFKGTKPIDVSYFKIYKDIDKSEYINTIEGPEGMIVLNKNLVMFKYKNKLEFREIDTWDIVCTIDTF